MPTGGISVRLSVALRWPGKAAHEAKTPGPFCGLNRRMLRPLESQAGTDVVGVPRLHETEEPGQQQAGIVHLEA